MNWIDNFFNKKPKIGLALSGGATLGAAHIGVLQVLEEAGIHPDYVAGTSVGALIGATYCAGVPLDEIKNMFFTVNWPTLIKVSLKNTLSIFDTQPMETFLKKKIGDINFEDLQIPFAAVTCDILTGNRVVLDHGPLAPAIRASASIPGLFSPIEMDDYLLVDGGVVDNLPVEQVKAMGAGYIIACDISYRTAITRKPENPFDMFQIMFNIMQDRGALISKEECDCYIRPNIAQFSCWGFAEAEKIMNEGRKAAIQALPQLFKVMKK